MVIVAEIPGFEPDELIVQIQGDRLRIFADQKQPVQGRVRCGHFEEFLQIPLRTDPAQVRASYHDGELEVHVPIAEGTETKPLSIQLESSWYGPNRP